MFDFADIDEDDPIRTAYGRYLNRQALWKQMIGNWTWWPRHQFWWILHNCFIHILIGILPLKSTMDLHDWSSKRLAGDHL